MKPESFPLKNALISNKEEREYNDKKFKTKRMQRLGDAAFNSVAGTRGTGSMTSFAWSSAAKWPLRTIRMRQEAGSCTGMCPKEDVLCHKSMHTVL
jgi:hypothetical protein